MSESSGLTRRGGKNKFVDGDNTSSNVIVADVDNDKDIDSSDDPDDEKTKKFTLMEEVLILGLKEKEVCACYMCFV